MGKLVSIVVPVYNCEKYIAETVKSILTQTYQDFEVIFVDDESTDSSRQILEKFGDSRIIVTGVDEESGAYAARNKGVAMAKGDYIAFLDSDDIWHKDKLAKTVAHLEKNKAAFVFTGYEFADENAVGTGRVVKVPEKLTYDKALSRTVIFTSTVMFDMSKLTKADIKMPNVKSEDTATWWQILRKGIVAYGLNENLVLYRRSGNTLSSNKVEAVRRIWNLYRKVEHLPLIKSFICFIGWGFGAVTRRL